MAPTAALLAAVIYVLASGAGGGAWAQETEIGAAGETVPSVLVIARSLRLGMVGQEGRRSRIVAYLGMRTCSLNIRESRHSCPEGYTWLSHSRQAHQSGDARLLFAPGRRI